MFGVDDVDLIVKELAEDFVAQLRAFQSARHPAFDENPEHIWLPLDPVPGEGDRTARLVLQLKATPQVSHNHFDALTVFARGRQINLHSPFGALAEGVFQIVREDADDNLYCLSGLIEFEIRDADVNLVGSGEWGVGNGEWGGGSRVYRMRNVQRRSAKDGQRDDQRSPYDFTNLHSQFSIPHSPLPIPYSPFLTPHSPFPIHYSLLPTHLAPATFKT